PEKETPPPQDLPLRLVHVTRFVPQKNSEAVLEILIRLRERGQLERFHVDILGDGPGRDAFLRTADAHSLTSHLTFHGAQPSILPFLLRGAFFLTTSRWEGLPL